MGSGSESTVKPEDKRTGLRQQPADRVAALIELPGDEFVRAEIVEVSRTGLRFKTTLPLAGDTVLTVWPPAGSGLPKAAAKVVREISEGGEGQTCFEYGLAYVDTPTEDRNAWFLKLRAQQAA
jgi:hypothetical protein